MSTLISYNGLQIVDPEPTADGGKAINDNFKNLLPLSGGTLTVDAGAPINISFTSTATSGTITASRITVTYNQASGTAANTDLLINRTETNIGSGDQNLVDLQVGGTSQFRVDHGGTMTAAGDANIANNLNVGSYFAGQITVGVAGATLTSTTLTLNTDIYLDASDDLDLQLYAATGDASLLLKRTGGAGQAAAYGPQSLAIGTDLSSGSGLSLNTLTLNTDAWIDYNSITADTMTFEDGGFGDGGFVFLAGGTELLRMKDSGNTIVSGNMTVSGTLYATTLSYEHSDPATETFYPISLKQALEGMRTNTPPRKWGGVTLFFNKDRNQFEVIDHKTAKVFKIPLVEIEQLADVSSLMSDDAIKPMQPQGSAATVAPKVSLCRANSVWANRLRGT